MNILVTGGAGYIGSAITEALLKAGHSVTVYDSLVTGHLPAVPEGVLFVRADLSDNPRLAKTLTDQSFDGVIHCAAFIEAGESMKDPGRFYQNNLINSLTLMETAVRAGVKRFLLSSTAAVYQSNTEPLTEESPLGPTNVYGHTKLMVEQALDWYSKIHGLHYAALRYFNAAGALPGRGEAHQPEITSDPSGVTRPSGATEGSPNLRHRLSHAGWHLYPGLHSYRRFGLGAPAGPGWIKGTRLPDLQSGKWKWLFGPGSDRDRPSGDRAPDPGE